MRLRDENKRKLIVQTAIKLFSEQPFHKVRLDDVAAAAGVGKGTVYIYFKNKEDLYYSLVYDGFAEMVNRSREQTSAVGLSLNAKLRAVIGELVRFAIEHPQLFEVMRTVAVPDRSTPWDAKRQEFSSLIENIIQQGVQAGEFVDSNPERTSLYLPAMVRAVMLYGPKISDATGLTNHVAHVLIEGIGKDKE